MENPWTIKPGSRTLLSEPEHGWEWKVNEGPQYLEGEDGTSHIIFSANFSGVKEYTQGMLKLEGENPIGRENWVKHPEPVLGKNVGHLSFTKDKETGKNLVFYHYKTEDKRDWGDR